jgi:hypothetical protein
VTFDWAQAASLLLKAEIAREGVTLAQLAKRLQALGCAETEASLKNKLYRGTFAMTFFLQCVAALDSRTVDAASVIGMQVPRGKTLDDLPAAPKV